MKTTRKITEFGMFAALFALLMLGGFYIPVAGNLFLLALPLPLVIMVIRNGYSHALASGVVGALVAVPLVSPIVSLTFLVFGVCAAMPIGYGLKTNREPLLTVFLTSVGIMAVIFAVNTGLVMTTGQGILEMTAAVYQEVFEGNAALIEKMKSVTPEATEQLDAQLKAIKVIEENFTNSLNLLFPSLLIITSMLLAVVVYMISGAVIRRLPGDYGVTPRKSFGAFTYPKHFAYGAALMIALAYVLSGIDGLDQTLVLANFMYLFNILFLVQVAALIYGILLKRHKQGLAVFLSVLVFFAASLLFGAFLPLLGFIDVLFNFRKRMKQVR